VSRVEGTAHELVTRGRDGHVAIISMQRPAKRNAIDRAMADALDAALNELDDDDDLWAGVLTGTPDVFSAGSDLTAGGDYVTARGGEYGIIRRTRRTPLIAAVEGPALGGGLEIVLACDLVVASTAARFGLPEVGIGVLGAAVALAQEICRNAPLSVQACLAAVHAVVASDDELGWQVTAEALAVAARSADAREGVAAFLEKRAPEWSGR
jgi:enoyl-CoA hydratase